MGAYLTYLRRLRGVESRDTTDTFRGNGGARGKSQSRKLRRQQSALHRESVKNQRSLVRQLENESRSLQSLIDELDGVLSDPNTYETESTADLAEMMQKKSRLEEQLQETEDRWYAVQEELDKLESTSGTEGIG